MPRIDTFERGERQYISVPNPFYYGTFSGTRAREILKEGLFPTKESEIYLYVDPQLAGEQAGPIIFEVNLPDDWVLGMDDVSFRTEIHGGWSEKPIGPQYLKVWGLIDKKGNIIRGDLSSLPIETEVYKISSLDPGILLREMARHPKRPLSINEIMELYKASYPGSWGRIIFTWVFKATKRLTELGIIENVPGELSWRLVKGLMDPISLLPLSPWIGPPLPRGWE